MRWQNLTEAAASLGITKSALRSKGGRRGWPRKEDRRAAGSSDNNNRYMYAVPESEDEAKAVGVDRWVYDDKVYTFEDEPETNENEVSGDVSDDEDDDYTVDEPSLGPYIILGADYIFNIPSKPRQPWVVATAVVKRLVAMYSRDGDAASINMIARELGWHRKTVMETLKALGKTHDSLPFTDEELAAESEDALVEDLVRRKEEKVHVRANRIDWQKTKDLADKARRWEEFVKNSMSGLKVEPPLPMPKWKQDRIRARGTPLAEDSRFTLVTHATDLHWGKEGWLDHTGEEFNREICRDRLRSSTTKLIERVSAFGAPKEVIIGVGGDWFHIDSYHGTTTKGTPQDHDGNYLRIYQEGCSLAWEHIEMWRSAVPLVRVVCVRGNHDYISTSMLIHWLQAKYQDAIDVMVGRSEIDREYLKVGNTILGLTHGDAVKDKDLVTLMAYEAKHMWSDTRYRLWLTGHWHTQMMMEQNGVLVEHLPSLAGTDAYHSRHGYVGNRKALMAHIIDDEDGPIARVLVDCD